jgi:curved DNA-binding protein
VKPETQSGTKVRLRGKGRDGTDLIITYQVKLPTNLTEHQRSLLREMQQG